MGTLEHKLGGRLQELRNNADLTQEEVARKARLDWKYLAAIENGRKSPSLAVLARLMQALGVEPPDVFVFKLKARESRRDPVEEAIVTMIRRMRTPEKRLLANMIRGALRRGVSKAKQ